MPQTSAYSSSSSNLKPNLFVQFHCYLSALLSQTDPSTSPFVEGQDAEQPTKVNQHDKGVRTDFTTDSTAASELLWVVEPNWIETTLAQADADTVSLLESLDIIDIDVLLRKPLPRRYEFISFWMPTVQAQEFQTYLAAFIRHRDMFAVSTIAVLHHSIDLHPYGFVTLADTPIAMIAAAAGAETMTSDKCRKQTMINDSDPSSAAAPRAADTNREVSTLTATLTVWQFNLYDYKPRPNWLNADYWANPENWGKYRW